MIVKSLSRKSGGNAIGSLFRYLFREQKVTRRTHKTLSDTLTNIEVSGKPAYVAGIRLDKADVRYLLAEMQDAKLLSELKAFKGTVKEFIQQQLMAQRPDVAKELKPLVITHNLRNRSIEGYIKEFEQNNANRIYQRNDQVAVQHTILSWATADTGKITDAMLKDMAKEYIRLRGENNLYCFTKHEDTNSVHLHVAVSGTQLNGLSSRISKKEFADIKLGMDLFQSRHFAELSNSLPQHGKGQKEKELRKIYKFDERATAKNSLLRCLDEIYGKATSADHFLNQLKEQSIEPYERSGKLTGVTFEGYKFRFSRLGIDLEQLKNLDEERIRIDTSLQEMSAIRNRSNDKEKSKNTIEPIRETTNQPLTENEQKLMLEFADIRNSKSERGLERDNEHGTDEGISEDQADTHDDGDQADTNDREDRDMDGDNDDEPDNDDLPDDGDGDSQD